MSTARIWTGAGQLRLAVQRQWETGRILAARCSPEPLFPLRVPLRRPDRRALLDRFDEVRAWIRELEAESAATLGHGYQLEWEEVNHRQLGSNRVPRAAIFQTEDDAVRFIGRSSELRRFGRIAEETARGFAELMPWLAAHPLTVLELGEDWSRVLSVLQWFRERPRPGVYLRQVDAPGVDSKFIEGRKALISELLELVLGDPVCDPSAPRVADFERRYGLLTKPVQVRIRILDRALSVSGLMDVAAPVEQLAALDLSVRRIFVTENDTNAIAFPELPDAAVVFGRGYALELLGRLPWLHRAEIFYWGDLDTHGFAILDRFRESFPHARSLLMDRPTLLEHRGAWTQERADQRCDRRLERLTPEENALYEDLRADRLGAAVRLEQERIAFGWLTRALSAL